MLEDATERIDRKIIIAGVVCLVVGWLVGWLLFGWVIWPVSWTDADPADLRREQKEVYVSMVADSYSLNGDRELARERVGGFDQDELDDILTTLIQERQGAGDEEAADRLESLGAVLEVAGQRATAVPEATPQAAGARIKSLLLSVLPICGVLIVLLLIVTVIAIVVLRFLRRPSEVPAELARGELAVGEEAVEAPLGHFVTSYQFGDDGYDTSFNIETPDPDGQFLGACGVGFSEVIGEGGPDNIIAFEIWLFDKTDLDNVQTVTKVLMSSYAYNNEILRAKMRDRGEAILADKGGTVVIDGMGLTLTARIADFAYGTDPALPEQSYFETLTTELVPEFKA